MDHITEAPRFLRDSFETNIVLAVVKPGLFWQGADLPVRDYDDNHACARSKTDIGNVLQGGYANSLILPTEFCHFIVVIMRGREYSRWFAQVLFLLREKSHGVAENEEEVVFVQYFEVKPPVAKINRESHFFLSD